MWWAGYGRVSLNLSAASGRLYFNFAVPDALSRIREYWTYGILGGPLETWRLRWNCEPARNRKSGIRKASTYGCARASSLPDQAQFFSGL